MGLLSVVIHELGHATAAFRYGARVGNIGIGIYLRYPVMYSDVTDVWKLQRWQRVTVDLGGVYFQLITAAIYAMLYFLTRDSVFVTALWLISGSIFMSLNPIFKFDAYWVLSDSLGITNLSSVPFRLLFHIIHRLRGDKSEALPWARWLIVALSLYSVFYFIIWISMMISIFWLIIGVVRDLLPLWNNLSHLNYATLSWQTLISAIISVPRELLFRVFAFVLVLYFVAKQIKILVFSRKMRASPGNTR